MPEPLPSDVVARLKSDSTAALAAALILAGSFPDLVLWAIRVFGGKERAKVNGAGGSNGVAKGLSPRAKPGSRQRPPCAA